MLILRRFICPRIFHHTSTTEWRGDTRFYCRAVRNWSVFFQRLILCGIAWVSWRRQHTAVIRRATPVTPRRHRWYRGPNGCSVRPPLNHVTSPCHHTQCTKSVWWLAVIASCRRYGRKTSLLNSYAEHVYQARPKCCYSSFGVGNIFQVL